MRRLLQRVRAGWGGVILVAAAGLGCPGADDSGTDETEEGTDEPPSLPPSFEGLAALELEVSAAQHEDITVEVAGLRYDTRVDIDGRSWALGGSGPALLDADTLQLSLGGAMVVGEHELSLVHSVGSEQLRSEVLTIHVVASEPGPLSATLYPDLVDLGDHLLAHGQGGEAVLGLVDEAGARLQVRAGAWSAAGFELELPGLLAGVGPRGVDVSIASLDAGADGEPARWVVTAYLADGGATVYARTISIDGPGVPLDEPGELLELWSLDDDEQVAALGPHELARIEAVTLLDRMLVLGVEARRDAESSSPGDHLLVTRWLTATGEPAPPVLLRGPSSRDLDLPGDARLWSFAGHARALSVRLGLGFPWLLTIASNGLPSLVDDPGEFVSVPVAATGLRSGDGAFGSRHAFALEDGPEGARVRVLRINRWSEQAEQPGEVVDVIELPATPSGPPSLALLDGVPTLVLPMGPELDVIALRSSGAATLVEDVIGLRCDQLGTAGPSFDGIGDTVPLACLLGGELRLGALGVD